MRAEIEPTIPTFYVRYEDLVRDLRPTLMKLFCFLLEVPSVENTVIEMRINDYCQKMPAKSLTDRSSMYSEEQMDMIRE